MSHIRNIKEILGIQTGSRNVATSGFSNFTDSQLFFGSQFWLDNSQGASQDMSLSPRTSQQSSQEGSGPKFSSSYQNKPLLFGDFKDKAFGLLEKFEEDKQKAKEKTDWDNLTKEFHFFRETLSNLQQLVAGTEKNTAACQTILEQYIKEFSSTLQNNLNSLQRNITQQFETLQNKVNFQKKATAELEQGLLQSGQSTAELGSNLQSLKKSLQDLRGEQEREQNMLKEALNLLNILVSTLEHSAKPSPKGAVDSAIQTSPGLEQQISNSLQDNKLEDSQQSCVTNDSKHSQVEVLPQDSSRIIGKRKFAQKGRKRWKKRPLVPSKSSKPAFTDENSQPHINFNKQQNVSLPRCERDEMNTVNKQDSRCLKPLNRKRSSKAGGCVITPLSCWSQDSSSSECLAGIKPNLAKLSPESKITTLKAEGLWQLFDMGSEIDF